MKLTRFYQIVLLTMTTLSLSVSLVHAQVDVFECVGTEPCNTSVIFVVDVFPIPPDVGYSNAIKGIEGDFEEPEEVVIADNLEDENCAISPDGQDGAGIDGSPKVITSRLYPFQKTHGEYVVALIQGLLEDDSSIRIAHHEYPIAGVSWMPFLEIWQEPGSDKNIILVAIDTNGYSSQLIANRLQFAISGVFSNIRSPEAFDLTTGIGLVEISTNEEDPSIDVQPFKIQDVIINMSFALVPCDDIPTISVDDYINLASDELGQDPSDVCMFYVDCDVTDGVITHNGYDSTIDFAEFVRFLAMDLDPDLTRAYYSAFTAAKYYDKDHPEFAFNAYLDGPYLYAESDPIGQLIIDQCSVNGESEDVLPRRACIPVASAGNSGLNFPFAPAFFNGVLSVAADYNRVDDIQCHELEGVPPLSNTGAGYVRDGVFVLAANQDLASNNRLFGSTRNEFTIDGSINCLYGTSFAAPRLAYLAATLPYELDPSADVITNSPLPNSIDMFSLDLDGDGFTHDLPNFDLDGDGKVNNDACPIEGVQVNSTGC